MLTRAAPSVASTASTSGRATVAPSLAPHRTHRWSHARIGLCLVAHAKDDDEEDEGAPSDPGKPLRVERLLANLGYGKRKEVQQLVLRKRVVRKDGQRLKVGDKVFSTDLLLEGEELDPPFPMVILVNKPVGYVVTSPEDPKVLDPKVYDLLPFRYGCRRPFLSSVGRLDKATSGLLLMTDDGMLVHRITSPRKGIWKVYEATLEAPLEGRQLEEAAARFASGELQFSNEYTPLLPAKLEMTGPKSARVSICEGRYHQIRRMFHSIGHEVVTLHRCQVGGLGLGGLPEGEYRFLSPQEVEAVFSGPTAEDIFATEKKQLSA